MRAYGSASLTMSMIAVSTGAALAQTAGTAQPASQTNQSSTGAPVDLPPVSLVPTAAATVPIDQGLKQIGDIVHRMAQALGGIIHEARRTEIDVAANPVFVGGIGSPYPFGYDPEMLDPMMGYGFDFGLDTAPTIMQDTGKLLPPRKEVLDPLVAQVTNDLNGLQMDVSTIALPDSLSDDSRVQWQVLNDTVKRMQQHVQWLQNVTTSNLDDNALIAASAIHIHDDAAGVDDISKRLLKALKR